MMSDENTIFIESIIEKCNGITTVYNGFNTHVMAFTGKNTMQYTVSPIFKTNVSLSELQRLLFWRLIIQKQYNANTFSTLPTKAKKRLMDSITTLDTTVFV